MRTGRQKISPTFRQRLAKLGVDLKPREAGLPERERKQRFEKRVAKIKQFIAEHGHARVPHNYEDRPLANFLYRVRAGCANLTLEERQVLIELGVEMQPRSQGRKRRK